MSHSSCPPVPVMKNVTRYHFGILNSNVHMAWMRSVAGRLEMRYRYSILIVYNNFPWPDADKETEKIISEKADLVLQARAKHTDWNYADLYDPLFMPADLMRAHRDLDKAVWEAYGKAWDMSSEAACVEHLMKLYNDLVKD